MTESNAPVVDLLAGLIAIPSLSGEEAPVADWLSGYVEDRGLRVHRFDDNIWFTVGEGQHRLLLNSHLDVVPPSAAHPFPPFEPTYRDGRLYGRGSVDAKASVAAMTCALIELHEAGWSPPGGQVLAAFSTCEEKGWPYNGLYALLPHLPEVHAGVVGEPTELEPCVAQKGLLILRLEAQGRTAHAARAHLGDNAIERAARDLARLQDLPLDRVHPELGPVTVTPTVIEGGSARNVVPDRCTFYVDVRSTPLYTHPELTQLVADHVESEVHVHSDRFIPVDTPPDARIVEAARRANPGGRPFGSPTMSDWIFLKDLPVVKLGPGESERSHTPDESIDTAHLERAVGVYRDLIRAYFEAS